jgi:galactonate dehydratase
MLAIADVCLQHGVEFAPHNPTGPVAHLASLHACAAAPTLLRLEHQWNESPLFASLVADRVPPIADGAFAVPTLPGLGAQLDLAEAAAHPYVPLHAEANLDPRLG